MEKILTNGISERMKYMFCPNQTSHSIHHVYVPQKLLKLIGKAGHFAECHGNMLVTCEDDIY